MSPPVLDQCHCAVIRKAARHVTQHYDRHLAPAGVTVTQFGILSRLDRHGPLTVNQLAARLGMDRTTLGRILKPLEREGLVAVASDPADRRRRALSLTPAAGDRLVRARPLWSFAQASFEGAYGEAASEDLKAALGRVLDTALAKPALAHPAARADSTVAAA